MFPTGNPKRSSSLLPSKRRNPRPPRPMTSDGISQISLNTGVKNPTPSSKYIENEDISVSSSNYNCGGFVVEPSQCSKKLFRLTFRSSDARKDQIVVVEDKPKDSNQWRNLMSNDQGFGTLVNSVDWKTENKWYNRMRGADDPAF